MNEHAEKIRDLIEWVKLHDEKWNAGEEALAALNALLKGAGAGHVNPDCGGLHITWDEAKEFRGLEAENERARWWSRAWRRVLYQYREALQTARASRDFQKAENERLREENEGLKSDLEDADQVRDDAISHIRAGIEGLRDENERLRAEWHEINEERLDAVKQFFRAKDDTAKHHFRTWQDPRALALRVKRFIIKHASEQMELAGVDREERLDAVDYLHALPTDHLLDPEGT